MRDYILNNRKFFILALLWGVTGYLSPVASYVIIPVSILLLGLRGMKYELFMGFWLILILSDNYEYAGDIKNIYVVLLALFFFRDKNKISGFDRTIVLYIPFFLIAIVGLFFTPVLSISIQKLLSYFLVIVLASNYVRELYLLRGNSFLKELVYFACSVSLLGVIISQFSKSDVELFSGRTSGLFKNPNGFGIFASLTFMLFTFLKQFNGTIFNRKETIFVYIVTGISLFMCGSRTAVTTVFILLFFNSFFRFSPMLGFIMFVLVLLSYQIIITNIDNIIISLGLQNFFRIGSINTGSGRIIAWEFAWSEIKYDPYFGNGFNYTEYLFKKYYYELALLGHQGNAHNSYLTIWLDTGLFGLITYLRAFIVSFLRGARKVPVAFPIMFAIMFSIFYESWLTASLNPYTIVLFMMAGLFNIEPIIDTNEIEEIHEEEKDPIPVY